MLTKTVGEERCHCICGSGLWCICINFDSEAFPVKFLINFSISLEFLIHFSWKVKAVQATSEGSFSKKVPPVTVPHDFRAISQIQGFLQCSLHKSTEAATGRERITWKEDARRRGRLLDISEQ